MKIRILFLLAFISLILTSCQYKRITSSSKYYGYTEPGMIPTLSTYRGPIKVSIKDNGDDLIITPAPSSIPILDASINPNPVVNPVLPLGKTLAKYTKKYYFPELNIYPMNQKIHYWDTKLVLQALTVPIKIRPQLTGEKYGNAFPSQTETGLNFGIAGGYQFQFNTWNSTLNRLGKHITSLSFTSGFFIGSGAVDLKKTNTIWPTIEVERKAAIVTPGIFFILGYNNIHVGYALGKDYATGPGSPAWVYQGKTWHGIIVALDVIK